MSEENRWYILPLERLEAGSGEGWQQSSWMVTCTQATERAWHPIFDSQDEAVELANNLNRLGLSEAEMFDRLEEASEALKSVNVQRVKRRAWLYVLWRNVKAAFGVGRRVR